MNTKETTKGFRETLAALGPKYTAERIDFEMCGYRKLNKGYDIEISGMNDNRKVHRKFKVYVWNLRHQHIAEASIWLLSVPELIEHLQSVELRYKSPDAPCPCSMCARDKKTGNHSGQSVVVVIP